MLIKPEENAADRAKFLAGAYPEKLKVPRVHCVEQVEDALQNMLGVAERLSIEYLDPDFDEFVRMDEDSFHCMPDKVRVRVRTVAAFAAEAEPEPALSLREFLDRDGLGLLYEPLFELGVESPSDLADVEDAEFAAIGLTAAKARWLRSKATGSSGAAAEPEHDPYSKA